MRSTAVRHPGNPGNAGWLFAVLCSAIGWTGPAFAEPIRAVEHSSRQSESAPAADPWSVGLTPEKKSRAEELLVRGNELLVQNSYAAALQVYQQAIRAWDHPAIRANMAVCYINLNRTLEAYESVLLALRYGAAPFDKAEVHAATLNYKKLLESQIGILHVRCTELGATVTLDGHDVLDCPGEMRRALLPGNHQLVAQKREFLTITRNFTIEGRAVKKMDVRMVRLNDAARTERLWDTKIPLAVVGSGAALLLAGVVVQQKAESLMRDYDEALEDCGRDGCARSEVPAHVVALKKRAELHNRAANITLGAGALVGVTGLVLLYLNRPRVVRIDDAQLALWLPPVETPAVGLSLTRAF